jgi:hypothetical protein
MVIRSLDSTAPCKALRTRLAKPGAPSRLECPIYATALAKYDLGDNSAATTILAH